ncbi:FitA-like ribbon-helix-helix domain-containing protein [Noviherbaspirillum aridicola]|uniref:Antitoxin FitA-like ribbon-helix-helix domain-containing protein n=1 Tax=Noviherbaspirillum aridicola TaxID=2849687 RepID=A0ABQ4QB03_9BURK|nr:Arc family DNA-binding protein [Noviherbaspirillum aridicola]GIZ54067.1 hypothetical protein NCCP691_40810 [Noviherbaspirillum aridicola]
MSEDLRARLEELAKANRRSLQAEITAILEQSLSGQAGAQFDMDAFAENIADKVAAKLKKK